MADTHKYRDLESDEEFTNQLEMAEIQLNTLKKKQQDLKLEPNNQYDDSSELKHTGDRLNDAYGDLQKMEEEQNGLDKSDSDKIEITKFFKKYKVVIGGFLALVGVSVAVVVIYRKYFK